MIERMGEFFSGKISKDEILLSTKILKLFYFFRNWLKGRLQFVNNWPVMIQRSFISSFSSHLIEPHYLFSIILRYS